MTQAFDITALPARINHSVYQGDTFSHVVRIKAGGVLVDISGDSFTMTITTGRGTLVKELTVGAGIEITGTGELTATISATDTAEFPSDCELLHQLVWLSGDNVKTLERGAVKVTSNLV